MEAQLLQTTQKPAKKVKLLEEIQTKKEDGASSAAAIAQGKPSIETLQSMILDRLNQLESTHTPAEGSTEAPTTQ